MSTDLSSIKKSLSNLLDIIKPYISDESISLPTIKDKKLSIIETYELSKEIIDRYKEIIDTYLRNSKYINTLRNEFSESYLDNYLAKVDLVDKHLKKASDEIDKELSTHLASIDFNTPLDKIIGLVTKNINMLTSFIDMMQQRGISLDDHITTIQLQLLKADNKVNRPKPCSNHPLQRLGTDHDMAAKAMNFDISYQEDMDDRVWIDYRIPKSTSYCMYDLDKVTDIRLSEIKKVRGLNTDFINATNSIRCVLMNTIDTAIDKILVNSDIDSDMTILETYDGKQYRQVKSNVSSDVVKEILDGPNPVIKAYNDRVFDIIENNTYINKEPTDDSIKYINLRQYRGKSLDEICQMATTGYNIEDYEDRLSNVLTTLNIQKQVYVTRTHPDPSMIIRSRR